jgi:AmiR/NasT family two-component response regulator
MERFGLTAEQAFTFLKRISQDTNTKLADLAIELVRTRVTPGTQLLL